MRKIKFPTKWLIVGAIMVFLGTSFLAISMNSTVFGHGLHISESISHYVGLEYWSAIVFMLGNLFVLMLTARYLWQLGEVWKMPKVFYVLIVVLGVTLLGLSACPSGMFDVGEETSLISWIHIMTSRAMFITMMLISAMIVMCRHANTLAHAINVFYLIYAVICIVGFVSEEAWFMNYVMIFETLFLLGFMVSMAFCDQRREHLAEPMVLN